MRGRKKENQMQMKKMKLLKIDEDADSKFETEADGRFGYTITITDSCVTKKKHVPDQEKKKADGIADRNECDVAITNWIEHNVKWGK